MNESSICPLCGNKAETVITNYNFPIHMPPSHHEIDLKNEFKDLNVHKCTVCDYLYNKPQPASFYRDLYSNQQQYVVPKTHKHWEKILKDKSYKHILDIGGGSNSVFDLLGRKSRITIVDYKIHKKYKTIDGIKCFEGDMMEFLASKEKEKYDAIFLSHVIEHIPNPKEYIKQLITDASTNESDYLIEIPDISYYAKKIPYFTFCFEHCSLLRPLDILNIFNSCNYSLTYFNKKIEGLYMHVLTSSKRGNVINKENLAMSNNELIKTYKYNLDKQLKRFVKETGIDKNKRINLLRSGGGSANLFLYYLSKLEKSLVEHINPVDHHRAGQYIRSINKVINSTKEEELPTYYLDPTNESGVSQEIDP